jgi:hypothetical protein
MLPFFVFYLFSSDSNPKINIHAQNPMSSKEKSPVFTTQVTSIVFGGFNIRNRMNVRETADESTQNRHNR